MTEKAKFLEGMDQEFGISTLVKEFQQRYQDLKMLRSCRATQWSMPLIPSELGRLVLTLKDLGMLRRRMC